MGRCREIELSEFLGQNDDVSFEAILAEVRIEGESMVESVPVDYSKASAIDKAKIFVVVPHKNRLAGLFIRLAHTKRSDLGVIEMLHEFDGRLVTDFGANQSVGLGEDKVRCEELSPSLKQTCINGFRSRMMIVIFVRQSKKCAGIQKDFQGDRYRYLS